MVIYMTAIGKKLNSEQLVDLQADSDRWYMY